MTQEARDTYFRVKDLLVDSAQLVIMNEKDTLLLYTDAMGEYYGYMWSPYGGSKLHRATGDFHFSHRFRSKTLWGIMELELYSFVFCVRQPSKHFTVTTDHKILFFYRIRAFQIGSLESADFN